MFKMKQISHFGLMFIGLVTMGLVIGINGACVAPVDDDSVDGQTNDNEVQPGNEEAEFEVEVLSIGGFFYPASQFICADAEDEQEPSESCPEGAGCDGVHWHGNGIGAIALVDSTVIVPNVFEETIDDPDHCRCGYGKVADLPAITITVLESDVINYEEINENELELSAICE